MLNFNLKRFIPGKALTPALGLLAILGLFLALPNFSLAQAPLVPCGGIDCSACDLFEGTRRMINFLLFTIAVPLATVALIAGGAIFLTSGGSEKQITLGKSVFWYTIFGMLLAFGAWVIINTILNTFGFKIPPGQDWFNYQICEQFDTLRKGAIPPAPTPEPPETLKPPGLPAGQTGHDQAVLFLKQHGIDVVSSSGCLGKNEVGCTTLEGIPATALVKIAKAKETCEKALNQLCSFKISGAAETLGHGDKTEHGPGRGTFDIQTPKYSDYNTYGTLTGILRALGGKMQCEAKGNEKGIKCNGEDGPVNHLHVSGL